MVWCLNLVLFKEESVMVDKMIDRVKVVMKNPKNIRNIAICAHIDIT